MTDDVTALDLADAPAPDGSTDDAAPDGSTDDAAPSTDVDASPDLAQADTVGADQSVSDVQGSGSPDLSGLRFVGGGGCSALEPGASGGGAPLFLLLLAFVGWGWRRRRSEGSA